LHLPLWRWGLGISILSSSSSNSNCSQSSIHGVLGHDHGSHREEI
jgi:hypothetical protein